MGHKRIATLVGFICGAELVIVAVIGGAGLTAFVGWEGALVLFSLVWAIVARRGIVGRNRQDNRSGHVRPGHDLRA